MSKVCFPETALLAVFGNVSPLLESVPLNCALIVVLAYWASANCCSFFFL